MFSNIAYGNHPAKLTLNENSFRMSKCDPKPFTVSERIIDPFREGSCLRRNKLLTVSVSAVKREVSRELPCNKVYFVSLCDGGVDVTHTLGYFSTRARILAG